MIYVILIICVAFLAYSNGANDNFKGVATLFGSRTLSFKKSLIWATVSTFLGSICSIFLAKGILKNFSGKGLVPDDLLLDPNFAIAIALGAALTVFIATKIGMPISTTHALVGSLFGVGLLAVGSSFNFQKLTDSFVMPLLLSPFIAALLAIVSCFVFTNLRKQFGITKKSCLCVVENNQINANCDNFTVTASETTSVGIETCKVGSETYQKSIFGISSQKIVDVLHFISAGTVGFARGLNDTPKIAGILLIVGTVNINWFLVLITIVMAIGGILNAKKVAHTMSEKITPMNTGQGLTANFVTTILVLFASKFSLPVSTTHVSVGTIFGIGTVNKTADVKMIIKIVSSWVLTLPLAALLSGLIFYTLRLL
uniref:anion permease n=1 Tax=Flavobacterium sp. TaxID=239 RepID=UPI0040482C51